MKMKAALYPVMIAVLLLLIGTACNKSAATRSDAKVASDVQSKIFSDPNVQSRQISVQSANGVVTLSGNVNSDAERTAAAADAAGIDGVKTVVNNLTTQSAQAQPPAAEQQPAEETQPATETRPAKKPAMREHRSSARHERNADSSQSSNSSSSMPASSTSGNTVAESTPPPPPPPPQPKKVTVPSGTSLSIRLIDTLDSEKNQVGDQFRATLNAPVVIDDEVVIPQDADVQGRVVDVKSAGRYAGAADMVLELTTLSFNGKTYNLSTNQWSRQTKGRGKSTAGKVGGGAVLGAIIGGIAGGGKGAAIGSIAGAGAGGGVATVGKGQQIHLGSEALLSFNLQNSIVVTTQPGGNQNNRRSMDQ
ncbi:MAG TPA: BON domain-containing protein [Terriglobales bacterium]|nr:BON domain-containing protein [Terriglobales bacterium]